MTVFDPSAFLDATTTEVNERLTPLPEQNPDSPDGLYSATIGAPSVKQGSRDDGTPWVSIKLPLKLDIPPSLQESLKYPSEYALIDNPFLDLTPAGTIDNAPGRNRAQKAYRDATGTNVAGQPFAWRMLEGQRIKVGIRHELYQDAIQMRPVGPFKA
jgi:hypothetical protein